MKKVDKKEIIARILAWIGLIIITIILCVLAYALINANGKLALSMIITLAFVSIIYWIGIKLYKDMKEFEKLKYKDEEQRMMNEIARTNTKNIK
ncbi:MAG: hypothetical protein J6P02_02125 [Lachnospiraceae bacterium]|nr:hypothetical protein [Lachnospiraceae bacterium]